MKLKKKELFNEVDSILDGLRNNLEMQESCNIAELNISTYNALMGKIEAQLESVNNKIEKKIKAPENKISFSELVESFNDINNLLFCFNAKIEKNNNLVNEYNKEYIKLVDDVWYYCIHDSENLIESYEKNMNSINKALIGMKKNLTNKFDEIEKIKKEITQKSNNLTSVQPAVDQINKTLVAYGFT